MKPARSEFDWPDLYRRPWFAAWTNLISIDELPIMPTMFPGPLTTFLQFLISAILLLSPTVVAESEPPGGRIRTISYNVQFLPGLAAVANKRPDAAYRAQRLSRLLGTFDIVGLNEAFDDRHRQTILSGLQASWGHTFAVVTGPAPDRPGRVNGGLVLATRLPMIAHHSMIYRHCSRPEDFGLRADGHAAKGVLHARLKRHTDSEQCLDVFVTHLEARDDSLRPKQYEELAAFLRNHTEQQIPTIILGDFNTRGTVPYRKDPNSQYRRLLDILQAALPGKHVLDLWPHHHPHQRGGTSEQESSDIGKRIDYTFLAVPATENPPLQSTDVRVNPYLDDAVTALSDHSAVEAEFVWTDSAADPLTANDSVSSEPDERESHADGAASESGRAAPKRFPFVPGFERFGRHVQTDADKASAGRLLMAELSCTACHASEHADRMPQRGPVLDGAGSRLQEEWIRAFLSSPAATEPGTLMPDLLHGLPPAQRRQTIDALTAFLVSLKKPFPEIRASGTQPVPHEFWNQGDPEQGTDLYHTIGCIACHEPDPQREPPRARLSPVDRMLDQLDPDEIEELGLAAAARPVPSVPFGRLNAKYTARSLTWFLLAPHAIRPAGRMPDFQLGVLEAADIASWLLQESDRLSAIRSQPDVAASPSERPDEDAAAEGARGRLIARGRALFVQLRCAACHDVDGISAADPSVPPLTDQNMEKTTACVSQPGPHQPRFELDTVQIDALRAAVRFSEAARAATGSAADQVHRLFVQFNCFACHERDGAGGVGRYRRPWCETVGQVDIGDEGRLPPVLDHVGWKIPADRLRDVLDGQVRLRPHMKIRMPVFGAAVRKQLPELLQEADCPKQPADAETVFGDLSDPELIEAGRRLLDTGCIQCHGLRGDALPGVVGVDLDGVTQRVRPDWFRDFLLDPGSLRPRTRMPTFFPGGRSQLTDVLDGDPQRQIAALWAWLNHPDAPLPDKLAQARSRSWELVPSDRPILLRTFMEHAGPHALAVGSTRQTHFAFDTERCRLATLWKGRFLDARGTWFERFAPNAEPLGTDVIHPGSEAEFARLPDPMASWPEGLTDSGPTDVVFGGYRLETDGNPVLLYNAGGVAVEDRIVAIGPGRLRRTLQFSMNSRHPENLWFRVAADRTLDVTGRTARTETGLTVTLQQGGQSAVIWTGRNGSRQEWRVRIGAGTSALEVLYVW